MNAIASAVTCPYCKKPAELVSSRVIYGTDYGNSYLCRPCNAYVGCHRGTTIPLGTLADKETRGWRQRAHAAFDPLWKSKPPLMTRKAAYSRLAELLGIPTAECHISHFTAERCREVVRLINLHFPRGSQS